MASGHAHVQATSEQVAALRVQLEALKDNNDSVRKYWELIDDDLLHRFITARNGNLHVSLSAILRHLEWRTEFGVDNIWNEDFSEFESTQELTWQGYDRFGHPILLWRIGKQDLTKKSSTRMVRYLISMLERGKRQLGKAKKFVIVLNCKSVTRKTLDLRMIKTAIPIIENNYPETQFRTYAFPIGSMILVLWKIISTFLDPGTVYKIRLLSNHNDPSLLECFTPQQIQAMAGDTSHGLIEVIDEETLELNPNDDEKNHERASSDTFVPVDKELIDNNLVLKKDDNEKVSLDEAYQVTRFAIDENLIHKQTKQDNKSDLKKIILTRENIIKPIRKQGELLVRKDRNNRQTAWKKKFCKVVETSSNGKFVLEYQESESQSFIKKVIDLQYCDVTKLPKSDDSHHFEFSISFQSSQAAVINNTNEQSNETGMQNDISQENFNRYIFASTQESEIDHWISIISAAILISKSLNTQKDSNLPIDCSLNEVKSELTDQVFSIEPLNRPSATSLFLGGLGRELASLRMLHKYNTFLLSQKERTIQELTQLYYEALTFNMVSSRSFFTPQNILVAEISSENKSNGFDLERHENNPQQSQSLWKKGIRSKSVYHDTDQNSILSRAMTEVNIERTNQQNTQSNKNNRMMDKITQINRKPKKNEEFQEWKQKMDLITQCREQAFDNLCKSYTRLEYKYQSQRDCLRILAKQIRLAQDEVSILRKSKMDNSLAFAELQESSMKVLEICKQEIEDLKGKNLKLESLPQNKKQTKKTKVKWFDKKSKPEEIEHCVMSQETINASTAFATAAKTDMIVLNVEKVWVSKARSPLEVVEDFLSQMQDFWMNSLTETVQSNYSDEPISNENFSKEDEPEKEGVQKIKNNPAFKDFCLDLAELQQIHFDQIDSYEKTKFFLNILNLLVLHGSVALEVSMSHLLDHMSKNVAYDIGGKIFTISDVRIECFGEDGSGPNNDFL